jgi:L-ascorbate metabolism protein UlaG (beta-lactamase superfamily)
MPPTRIDRRRFPSTAAAGTTVAGVGTTATAAAAPTPARRLTRALRRATPTFRWLGTAGWRIDIGSRTLLVDPYLSRFPTGLFQGAFNPDTELVIDTDAIAQHVGQPEWVLVTHSHWDHFNDVPHIAATTGAQVIGTLTTYHLALAYGVAPAQLSQVTGGEVLDFGDYTVEVVASLHSRNRAWSVTLPGVRVSTPPRPSVVGDLPEGDTLAFQVAVKGGPSVLLLGASDFVERNLHGLTPDVAMIAVPSSDATFAYTERLVRALGRPRTVVPVHWDNFEVPLANPPQTDPDTARRLDALVETVREIAPRTNVVIPEYMRPYSFA